MVGKYSDFYISRKQAQSVAFAIIADIEKFCEENSEEFQKFLKSEELKEKE